MFSGNTVDNNTNNTKKYFLKKGIWDSLFHEFKIKQKLPASEKFANLGRHIELKIFMCIGFNNQGSFSGNYLKAIVNDLNEKKLKFEIFVEAKDEKSYEEWRQKNAEILDSITYQRVEEWRQSAHWQEISRKWDQLYQQKQAAFDATLAADFERFKKNYNSAEKEDVIEHVSCTAKDFAACMRVDESQLVPVILSSHKTMPRTVNQTYNCLKHFSDVPEQVILYKATEYDYEYTNTNVSNSVADQESVDAAYVNYRPLPASNAVTESNLQADIDKEVFAQTVQALALLPISHRVPPAYAMGLISDFANLRAESLKNKQQMSPNNISMNNTPNLSPVGSPPKSPIKSPLQAFSLHSAPPQAIVAGGEENVVKIPRAQLN